MARSQTKRWLRYRTPLLVGAIAVIAGALVATLIYALGPHQAQTAAANAQTFGTVQVRIVDRSGDQHTYCLLAARTEAERTQGLMFVQDRSLGGHAGMLFISQVDSTGPFWMRNTPLPLSLAYINATGSVASTTDMPPCTDSATCPTYSPTAPYRYALETPQGQLTSMGVAVGSTVTITANSC